MSEGKMHKKRNLILVVLSVLFMAIIGAYEVTNNVLTGETRVCTIENATLVHDAGNGAPTEYIRINTPDCGEISITRMKTPDGVNMAKLTQVLEAHRGEKFEFIGIFLQLQKGVFGSIGVTSLEPVQ